MQAEPVENQREIFLVITRDKSIFNPSSPAGRFIIDIGSVVPELHVIYIGKKHEHPKKISDNTWVYTARSIPFLNDFSVYSIIRSQLIWKRHFRPTTMLSIGDEIAITSKLARKYKRPLYVFYSYMKLLGKKEISINALIHASPKKIFVPNTYVSKAITSRKSYKSKNTEIKLIAEFIDIDKLESLFQSEHIRDDIASRNKIFTMVTFPRRVNIRFFKMIKSITREILPSISRFKFTVVVKKGQFWQARLLRYMFKMPLELVKESEDSISIFRTSRLTLYFEPQTTVYKPILYSFIAGCPVLSSGDEYSNIVLFNSGLEEYSHIAMNGKFFGSTITKLINDPYLYTKYKMNCIGFAKNAFTHDKGAYLAQLRESLNTPA